MYSELIQRQGVYNNDPVNQQFFSQTNVDIIHKMIQNNIYKQTNKLISRQSDTELFIIMQSIHKQHGRNMQNFITEQVDELNTLTANEASRLILPKLLQYIDYLKKTENEMEILDYGFNTSTYGLK